MKKKVKEGDIIRKIREFLHLTGIPNERMNTGAMRQGKRFVRFGFCGMSDIIGIFPKELFPKVGGHILCIEVKRPGGKLTENQENFLMLVKRCGGCAFVAYNLEDVVHELEKYVDEDFIKIGGTD